MHQTNYGLGKITLLSYRKSYVRTKNYLITNEAKTNRLSQTIYTSHTTRKYMLSVHLKSTERKVTRC